MTYPIYDWRDRARYRHDSLENVPSQFLSYRAGMKDAEILALIWRWEFLRRHKLYQNKWNDSDGSDFPMLVIIASIRAPDPKTDYPTNLIFADAPEKLDLKHQTYIDLSQSWAENLKRLKSEYYGFGSGTAMRMINFFASNREPSSKRLRQPSQKKFPNLLRILDALAAGEKPAVIAKKLGSDRPITRQLKQALDVQAELTGLPRMCETAI